MTEAGAYCQYDTKLGNSQLCKSQVHHLTSAAAYDGLNCFLLPQWESAILLYSIIHSRTKCLWFLRFFLKLCFTNFQCRTRMSKFLMQPQKFSANNTQGDLTANVCPSNVLYYAVLQERKYQA